MSPLPDPDALAARFWAENATRLPAESKLAFARRARAYFETSMSAVGTTPAELAATDVASARERFIQVVLALHAGSGRTGR